MSMFQAVGSVFRHYATFQGRARRAEYWKFYLFNSLLAIVFYAVSATISMSDPDKIAGGIVVVPFLQGLYGIATFLPGLAVTCRRLHDIGRAGSYMLFVLIPVVGWIFLIMWLIQDGEPNGNQYGPNPKTQRAVVDRKVPAGTAGSTAAPSSGTTKCPHCGKWIEADAKFCTACGANLVTTGTAVGAAGAAAGAKQEKERVEKKEPAAPPKDDSYRYSSPASYTPPASSAPPASHEGFKRPTDLD